MTPLDLKYTCSESESADRANETEEKEESRELYKVSSAYAWRQNSCDVVTISADYCNKGY